MLRRIGIRLYSIALILAMLLTAALPSAATQAAPAGSGIVAAGNLAFSHQYPETHTYANHMGPRSLAMGSELTEYVAYGGSHLYLYIEDTYSSFVQVVDPAWGVGYDPSIVLDSGGRPGISYLDELNQTVKYAGYSGSSWTLETVAPVGIDYGTTSLAFRQDLLGQMPGISYYAWENGQGVLKYADKSCNLIIGHLYCSWSTETVDSTTLGADFIGEISALGYDSASNPVIAYTVSTDQSSYNLYVAYKSSGTWTKFPVDSAIQKNSVSLASTGNTFYISYGKYNSATSHTDPMVAMSTSSGHSFTVPQDVDKAANDKADVTSIALDLNGVPFVAYGSGLDGSWEQLKVAHKVTSGSGTCPSDFQLWSCEVAMGNPDDRLYPANLSLAMGDNGDPFVVYTNLVSNDSSLKLNFKGAGNQWTTETVSTVDSRGSASSLALDSSGLAHIAYVSSDQDLYYTVETAPNTWNTGDPVTSGVMGYDTTSIHVSLALDGPSTPYIAFSYYGTLEVAHYVGSGGSCPGNAAWACEPVTADISPINFFISMVVYNHIPYVLFHNATSHTLVLAKRATGGSACGGTAPGWTCATIASPAAGEDAGLDAAMAIDSGGRVVMAYTRQTGGKRQLEAFWANTITNLSTGTAQAVLLNDIGYSAGGYVDATYGAHPYISYYQSLPGSIGVGVAELVGSGGSGCAIASWSCGLLVTSGDVGRVPFPRVTSIAADVQGNVSLAYVGEGQRYYEDLQLLRYVGARGNAGAGKWFWQNVDTIGDVGLDNSVALEANGLPRISYLDQTSGHLRYAVSAYGLYLPIVKH